MNSDSIQRDSKLIRIWIFILLYYLFCCNNLYANEGINVHINYHEWILFVCTNLFINSLCWTKLNLHKKYLCINVLLTLSSYGDTLINLIFDNYFHSFVNSTNHKPFELKYLPLLHWIEICLGRLSGWLRRTITYINVKLSSSVWVFKFSHSSHLKFQLNLKNPQLIYEIVEIFFLSSQFFLIQISS